MACVSKIGSLYEMVTKNVIVSTTNTIFGINVFCGLRHCSIISQLAAYGIAHKNRSVQGFLTSKNRFLTREEASELVRNNNQEMVVDRNAIREQLYSEDLY